MEQTLQIAINENVKTTAISHLGMNKGVLKLKVIYRQASFYLERETNNNQNDFIDIIFFLTKITGVIVIRECLLTDYLVAFYGKCDLE